MVISVATLVAAGQEVAKMIAAHEVTLADLLLLFIYLEVLAMVGVYLESGSLPIRMPLYIAMVALARHLILDMKHLGPWEITATAAGDSDHRHRRAADPLRSRPFPLPVGQGRRVRGPSGPVAAGQPRFGARPLPCTRPRSLPMPEPTKPADPSQDAQPRITGAATASGRACAARFAIWRVRPP